VWYVSGRCMYCMALYICDEHYVYVHMVKEKALGVFWVWQPIQCMYGIRTKIEAKD